VGGVSNAAARKLGMLKSGVIEADLAIVGTAPAKKRLACCAATRQTSSVEDLNFSTRDSRLTLV
jgi:rare lipoprotein A (peptidoglycan hydrolase)